MKTNNVKISEKSLSQYIMFNKPINLNSSLSTFEESEDGILLFPVRMRDYIDFNIFISAITIRKNSIFPIKEVLKMSYLEFLFYCLFHPELGEESNIPYLQFILNFTISLIKIVCRTEDVDIDYENMSILVNGKMMDKKMFDNFRRIILIQNDIDFDIDTFINAETELALKKAREFQNKRNKSEHTIEDYIDSLVIGLKVTEEYISEMSIRKFWRYIKRLFKQEDYKIARTAELSGMVEFKDTIQHWSCALEKPNNDDLIADEQKLRDKF